MNFAGPFRVNTLTVAHETIDNEAVIIEFRSGNYYSLDKSGADIWNLIVQETSTEELVTRLMERYGGLREEIREAVVKLLDELHQENLIVSNNDKSLASQDYPRGQVPADGPREKPPFIPPTLKKYTDMQELLLLDPIHEVDETGWPQAKEGPPLKDIERNE